MGVSSSISQCMSFRGSKHRAKRIRFEHVINIVIPPLRAQTRDLPPKQTSTSKKHSEDNRALAKTYEKQIDLQNYPEPELKHKKLLSQKETTQKQIPGKNTVKMRKITSQGAPLDNGIQIKMSQSVVTQQTAKFAIPLSGIQNQSKQSICRQEIDQSCIQEVVQSHMWKAQPKIQPTLSKQHKTQEQRNNSKSNRLNELPSHSRLPLEELNVYRYDISEITPVINHLVESHLGPVSKLRSDL